MSEETKNVVEETPVEEVKTPVEAAPETVETQAEVPAEAAAPAEAPKAEEPVVEKEEPVAEKAEEPVVENEEPVAEKADEPAADNAEEIAAEKEEPVAEKKATRRSLLNASVASEDFDWEAFEGSVEVYGVEDRKKIEEAYDQTLSKVVENEVVEGTVTGISKREVIIDIGYKSEGVIQTPEFRYNPDLKVGDKVEVFVESVEDRKGQLLLSHKKARALKSWDRINEAANNDEIVKGFIKTRTKGGMIVDVFGIEAFLPGSQIDIKPIRDYDAYVKQTLVFKIV